MILVVALVPCPLGAQQLPLQSLLDESPAAASRAAALSSPAAKPALLWMGNSSQPGMPTPRAGLGIGGLFRVEGNSTYATDRNNGSLWGGRGLNLQFRPSVAF